MNPKQKIVLGFLITLSISLFIGIFWIERELKFKLPEVFLEEPFRPANITVDTQRNFGPLPGIWRALAQGGEEGGGARMLQPTVKFLQRIEPVYIRLDHIYDDDYYGVVKGRQGDGLELDWSRLDATVEDILTAGAKPFFSLSYMPGALAESKIDKPRDWKDWQNLVKETVEHYSGRIDGVYYEVWNEPSLNWFGGWKMYGRKDYRQLYKYAVLGVESAQGVRPFKIGGPAIPEMDTTWIRLLYDFVLAENLRLDFVSWHRYSFFPQDFVNDVYQINVLANEDKYSQFAEIEKIITEWGPNSEKDAVYSGKVAASHAVATLRQLLDKISLAFVFEIKDGPDQGVEAWGLLSHELSATGIKEKPRFYLYHWLAEMKGERLAVSGEGSQIQGFAVKKNRTNYLILSNYLTQGAREESFQITFTGLEDGRYRLFQQTLFDQPEETEVQVGGGSLVLNVSLPEYSVMRVKLVQIGS